MIEWFLEMLEVGFKFSLCLLIFWFVLFVTMKVIIYGLHSGAMMFRHNYPEGNGNGEEKQG